MNSRRGLLGLGATVGVALGVALVTSTLAYADDPPSIFPPGSIGPVGPATDVVNFGTSPWFLYTQATYPNNVVDDDHNVVGQFDNTQSFFQLPFLTYSHDVISDTTGAAAAWNGAVDDSFALRTFIPLGPEILTIFGNDYLSNPDGASDYVTLFNNYFPIFDTFPDPAATAAADPGWLADFAALF